MIFDFFLRLLLHGRFFGFKFEEDPLEFDRRKRRLDLSGKRNFKRVSSGSAEQFEFPDEFWQNGPLGVVNPP